MELISESDPEIICVNITILDDEVVEDPEEFTVMLMSDNITDFIQQSVIVTIQDNDGM